MMKSALIMLTKTFPYGMGEAFIEREIKVAEKKYDEIILLPCQVESIDEKPREVPNNVKVFPLLKKSKFELLFYGMKYFIGGVINGELLEEFRYCNNWGQYCFSIYFYGKVKMMEKKCIQILVEKMDKKYRYTFYSYWFFDTALAALHICKKLNLERESIVVTRGHGYDVYKYRNRFNYMPFRNQTLEKIEKVYICSEEGARYTKLQYPGYDEKIETAYLGTEDLGIERIEREKGRIRIVTCSYIIPVKRVERLAESLKKLEEADIELQIEWICFGDGELRPSLVDYCKKYLKRTKVVFKGFKKNKDVLDYYKNHRVDMFINLSSSEGLPVSIMEAFSFGIPVIATDVGGTSEIVEDHETGILLNENFENEDLCKAILSLANLDIQETDKLRIRCRKKWEKLFSADINYSMFYDKLKRMETEKCNLEI